MKLLENGRYVCKSCGLSWEKYSEAANCCAKEAGAVHPGKVEIIGLQPGPVVELPEEPTVTYADTVPEPLAAELLGRAARHMHDRASTYDEPGGERSMGKAVSAFNAITGRSLTESEGWLLLQVLKDVRNFSREKPHQDSLEDCIAYAALKAEAEMCRLREWEDQQKT